MDQRGRGKQDDPIDARAPCKGQRVEALKARLPEIGEGLGVYRALLDELPEAVLVSDLGGTVLWANRAAALLFQEGCRNLEGRSLQEWTREWEGTPMPGVFWSGWVPHARGKNVHATVIGLPGVGGEVEALGWILRDRQRLEPVELARKQDELWYNTLAEAARDAIFVIGREGGVLYVNTAAARLVGLPPGELLGRLPEELFPSFERQRANLDRVFESGAPLFVEDEIEFQGRKMWLETSLVPLAGEDGRAEAVLGISRDATDRKQAEEALRRSELRYRATIDALTDLIHTVDRELRVVLCNRALERRMEELGLGPEIIGRSLFDLFPFLPERVREEYEEVFRTGRPVFTQEEIWLQGRLFITETHKIPILEGDGVHYIVTVIHDITERWQAEQALRESEERYRTLVETSPDAIVLTDLEGRVLMANQRAASLYGVSCPEELVGNDGFELLAPHEREWMEAAVRRVFERGTVQELEYTVRTSDGRSVPIELSLSLVLDAEERPTGFLAVAHDLTERKQLETQFLQAQKMETLGRLVGGIAHDFNNLLTALKGYAALACAEVPTESQAQEDLQQLLRIVDQGARLTRQLLSFARRQTLEPQVLDLNEIVADLERMLRRLIGETIEFRLNLDPQPCLVRADRAQLEQALMNLVVNARDAMPRGGRLTVET
ncbi:MAG: PAS domain S-box protein, partial [Chloroflexia bacterium]